MLHKRGTKFLLILFAETVAMATLQAVRRFHRKYNAGYLYLQSLDAVRQIVTTSVSHWL